MKTTIRENLMNFVRWLATITGECAVKRLARKNIKSRKLFTKEFTANPKFKHISTIPVKTVIIHGIGGCVFLLVHPN